MLDTRTHLIDSGPLGTFGRLLALVVCCRRLACMWLPTRLFDETIGDAVHVDLKSEFGGDNNPFMSISSVIQYGWLALHGARHTVMEPLE